MATADGPLNFDAYLRTTDFEEGIQRLEKRILGLTTTSREEANKTEDTFKRLGVAIGGAFAFSQMQQFAASIVKVRGEFQQLEIALGTMLKSKGKADALMAQIVDFAAKTPFDLQQVATGVKQLLAYGSASETVINELRMLGDVAAGVSQPLGDIVYLYGTLRTQGRAYATDIRQFAGRGIPIYEELAKVLGKQKDEVNAFVEAGKVGFKEVEQAFKNMAGAGGIFDGLTEKQAQSLTGLLSNFKDAVDRMLNDLGKKNEGILADSIRTATTLVDNYQSVVDIIKVLVITYGAYRTALLLAVVAQKLSRAALFVEEYYKMAKALGIATANHIAFNGAVKSNVYVIAATALAALIGSLVVFGKETDNAAEANKRMEESKKQVIANISKEKEEITSLVKVLQNQNFAESTRLEAYNKINAITPEILKGLDFTKAKTAELTTEVNNYIVALEKKLKLELGNEKLKVLLDKQASAQQAYNDAYEKLSKLEKSRKEGGFSNDLSKLDPVDYAPGDRLLSEYRKNVRKTFSEFLSIQQEVDSVNASILKTTGLTAKEIVQEQIAQIKGVLAITGKFAPERKKLEEQLITLENRLNKINPEKKGGKSFTEQLADANDFGRLRLLKTLQKTDDEYKAYIEKIISTRSPFKQGTKEYDQLTKLLNQVKKQNKDLTGGQAPAPFGSEAYWKKVSADAREAMATLDPVKDAAKIEQYRKQREQAELKVAEFTARYDTRSFEQTLDEKRKLFEEFEQYKTLKGKETAENDYQMLLQQAQSYQDYLNKQIAAVEAKIGQGTATDQDRANLLKLKSEDVRIFEAGIEEKKQAYELYNKWILAYGKEAADASFKELIAQGADYKSYLQNQITAIETRIKSAPALEDQNKLITIKNAYEIETEGLDKYKARIEETADMLGSLTEQIAFFNQEQAKISPFDLNRTLFLVGLRSEAEKQRKKLMEGYLVETNSFELKRMAIEKQYGDLRAALAKEYAAGRIKDNQYALQRIDSDEKAALAELREFEAQEILRRSKAYNEMQKIMFLPDDSVLKARIEQLKSALSELERANMAGTETYKKQLYELLELQDQLVQKNIDYFSEIGNIFSSIDNNASGLIGSMAKIGKGFSDISNYAKKFSELSKIIKKTDAAIKTAGTPEEALAAGALGMRAANVDLYTFALQGLLNVFNTISKNIAEKKARQQEYYDFVIKQQIEYNKLVNEELLSKSDKSFFTPDAIIRAANGIAAQASAFKDYSDGIESLSKNGQFILKDIMPGSLANKDLVAPLLKIYPDLFDATKKGVEGFNIALAKTLLQTDNLDETTKNLIQGLIDYVDQYNKAVTQVTNAITDLTGQVGQDLKNALVDAFKSGESAAIAFSNTIGNVLEKIIIEKAYAAILAPVIDKLGKDFQESYGVDKYGNKTGDQNLLDDLQRNIDPIKTASENFSKELQKQADLLSKEFNINILKGNSGTGALSGSIKSITEETASVISGQLNAIRITQWLSLDVSRNQLLALNRIAVNSDFLQRLENIDKNITKLASNNDLRAGGI